MPQAGNYNLAVASGVTAVRGGLAAVLPSWLSAIAPGQWGALPSSAFSSSGVGWSGTHPGGTGNYTKVVGAWSGGVLNTVGLYISGAFVPGIFLVLFGGGHNDYGGNELYAYGPLESNTPTWSRVTDPTIPAPLDVARDGSGNPVSRHTYDSLVYLRTQNKMLCIGAPVIHNISNTLNVGDLFDFAVDPGSVNPWSNVDAGFPAFGAVAGGMTNGVSGYDPATGKAWAVGKGNFQAIANFDAATSTWAEWAIDNPLLPSDSKAGLDPDHSLLVFITSAGGVQAWDLRGTPVVYSPTVTGTGPGIGGLALEWDLTHGRFGCRPKTGATMYFLTPGADPYSGGDAWAWSSLIPAGGVTPADQVATGTFGRWRRVDALGGYLLMPTADDPVYFYRDAA